MYVESSCSVSLGWAWLCSQLAVPFWMEMLALDSAAQ